MGVYIRRPIVVLFLVLVAGSGILFFGLKKVDSEKPDMVLSGNHDAKHDTEGTPLPDKSAVEIHSHELSASDVEIANLDLLSKLMRWDSEGLEVEVHSNGMESMSLDGRFTHVSAAIRDENGELLIQCFSGHTAMTNAINGRDPVRANLEDSRHAVAK